MAALLLVLVVPTLAWMDGDGGLTQWNYDCRWNWNSPQAISPPGGTGKESTPDQCGGVCLANPDCTYFQHKDGTCRMYTYDRYFGTTQAEGSVCGFVVSRKKN